MSDVNLDKPIVGADWPEAIRTDLRDGTMNPRVGTRLLSETHRVRVLYRPGRQLRRPFP